MESIGARLRQTRETKGYTVEQVARDTHIAKRFIEGLEQEDFTIFPGEPYLLGFLRTYSDYLGLEPQDMINLYKNIQIQEQPAPIDELIVRSSPGPVIKVALVAIVVIAVGVGIYFVISSGVLRRSRAAEPQGEQVSVPVGDLIEVADEIIEQRFSQGDRLMIPAQGEDHPVDLVRVGSELTIAIRGEEQPIEIGDEVEIDVNGDGQADVRIIVRSLDTVDSPPTVVMRLDRGAPQSVAATTAVGPVEEAVSETPAVGSTTETARQTSTVVIAGFDETEEFVVEVRFEGYCLFRYEADDESRVEQYFQQGETLRMSVVNTFKLWASNAGVARLRVAGQDLVLGEAGQVVASLIAWGEVPDSDTFRLELIPVY